jgi:anti-anti-sigma regulatory factor
MDIRQTLTGSRKGVILSCSDYISGEHADQLRYCIEDLSGKGVSIFIIDLSRVPYIAGNGLTMLSTINRKLRSNQGLLILTGMNRETSAVFALLSFSQTFICASSLSEANEMAEKAGAGLFEQCHDEVASGNTDKENTLISPSCEEKVEVSGKPLLQDGESAFPQPLIVECEECRSYIRVHTSGQFLCPSCNAGFHVERDGTVIF